MNPGQRSSATRTRLAFLAAAVVALLLVLVAPAGAHASLVETSPSDGVDLDGAPDEVTATFNEPVSAPTGGVRVFDEDGERVDNGEVFSSSPETVGVALRDGLGEGSYIVTWRVTSADGHVVRGAFVFTVGAAGPADDDLVAALFGGGDGRVVAGLAAVTRAAGYAGVLLFAGAALFLLVVARTDRREAARAGTWARRGAVLGAAAAALTIPLQAMAVTGLGLAALAPRPLVETLTSSVGNGASLRLLALVAALAVLARLRGAGHRPLLLVLGGASLGSFLVDGHTRTVEPTWLMVAADAIHLAAAAAWFGGLVVLADGLRRRAFDDDPVGAARIVARYSAVATLAVIAVTLAGGAMSWALVREPRALTSTSYGWTLLVKVGLSVVVVAIGVLNNRRLVPAVTRATTTAVPAGASVDPGAADAPRRADPAAAAGWAYLRRTTRLEVGLVLAVLLVTGFLVNLRPAAEAAGITGAFETYASVSDDLDLNLVVDPNQAGFNEIHLYLLDRTGRPFGDVEEATLRLTHPEHDLGPIERDPTAAGPGHWILSGRELTVPGEWHVEAVFRMDRFTEHTVTVPVHVNPR